MSDDDSRPLPVPVPTPAAQRARGRRGAEERPLGRWNRSPALLRAIERLRRRLPGDARFGDPVSTADRSAAALVAREIASMSADPDAGPSVVQELGMGALQLWQVLSETTKGDRVEQDLAILFTDLVGFSSWALKAGDAAAVELLRETSAAIEQATGLHGGRVIKRLGDGLMAVFVHPADGVGAALDACDALAGIEVAGHTPRMRAGVHWGRPTKVGQDYLGVDVNIAARVADEAKALQVLVSDAAYELLDVSQLKVGRARRLRAKGAPADLRVRTVSRLEGS